MERLRNYLRMHRRRWHLTQDELAFLFGYIDQSAIARLEKEERAITLAVAHACEFVFGVRPNAVFPVLFASMEEDFVERIHELRDQLLKSKPTQRTIAKLELLHEALNRAAVASEKEV